MNELGRFFQGATAKNKALVAAFEQKLNKPVLVSKFCHLTGALGAALMLMEDQTKKSGFRGISIYNEKTEIENETCLICNNHCRINNLPSTEKWLLSACYAEGIITPMVLKKKLEAVSIF